MNKQAILASGGLLRPARLTLAVVAVAGLAACALQEPYTRPPVDLPAGWQRAGGNEQWPQREWWLAFDDARLNELEQAALADNHELKAAVARIGQARALTRIAASNFYPAIGGSLAAGRKVAVGSSGNTFNAILTASYEPDLWHRFESADSAATADLLSAEEAQRGAALLISAAMARAYFQLAELDQRIELVRTTIVAAERVDAVIAVRLRAGAVSPLDRAQSLTNLAEIQATLPALLQAREATRHALALLAGRNPGDIAIQAPPLARVPLHDGMAVGLPSELLQRRPDIRQAEANLMSAHANIGVARAALYPRLPLSVEGGLVSNQLRDLLMHSSGTLALGIALLSPIFQHDALQAGVERSRERYEELLQQYHQTILAALADVENALVALEQLRAQEAAQQQAERQGQRAFELAEIRYRAGLTDTITWLTTQNNWLNAQNALLQTRFARIDANISLYRALGGGW